MNVRDLFGPVLVDRVVVRHRQRVGVPEVDLVLARPRLALGGLDANPRTVHAVPDLADERLVVRGREHVVVEDVGHRRRQVAVVPAVRLLVGLLEQEELQLGAEHRRESEFRGALDLGAQHLPGRRRHRRAVLPGHVAEHECRRLEPRDPAQRREVGQQREVAVPPLPARDRVARHRIHLHLEREQVVAALDRVPGADLVHEELAVEPLPHQPALHVGEGDDHGVDSSRLHVGPQRVEAEHERDPTVRAVRHVDNAFPSGA
jgi:hypothetical protein